jgi:hypothetical protein
MIITEILCELASAIVERQFYKDNVLNGLDHSFTDSNGDIRYIDEVQDEFNQILDIIEEILNGDK